MFFVGIDVLVVFDVVCGVWLEVVFELLDEFVW